MASYFDEHAQDTENQQGNNNIEDEPNTFIYLLRLLLSEDLATYASHFDSSKLPPPAKKSVVEALPCKKVESFGLPPHTSCPVCLGELSDDVMEMPCHHYFHKECLIPWLNKTNSCPSCRFELLTDDANYEEYKKFKQEEKEREHRVEELHNSMFS